MSNPLTTPTIQDEQAVADAIYERGVTAGSVGAKAQTPVLDSSATEEEIYARGEALAFPNKVDQVTPPGAVLATTVKGSGKPEDPFKVGLDYYANAAKAGGFDLARQWAGVAAMTGLVPYEQLKDDFHSSRMEQFKDPVSAIPAPDILGIGKMTVQSAPFLANVYAGGAAGGVAGAGIGAALGLPAAPETAGVSVPLLGISFGVGGSEIGAAGTAMTLSAGGAYMSARENGIPHGAALTKAMAYGAVAGVLQTIRLKALDQATKAGVAKFAESEVGKQTIADTVKKVAINLNFQAGVNAIQEATDTLSSMLVGSFTGIHNNYTNAEDWGKRLWDSLTHGYGEGLKGAVGMSAAHYAGGAVKGAFTKPKVSKATTDLGKAIEEAVDFLDQPTEEKLKELQQQHDELTKKIEETEKTLEEKAAEIVTQREQEIAEFNRTGDTRRRPPRSITPKQAREMVAEKTTPADLRRRAKEIADQIGLLNGSVEKFDYTNDIPKTAKESKTEMHMAWEARRAAEVAADAQTVNDFAEELPEAKGAPAGRFKRALLGGGKSTMTLSSFADNLAVFAKGKLHDAMKGVLDTTPEDNAKSKYIAGSITKAFTELSEAVGSLKRAKQLIDSGKRKAERGAFYNTKGDRQNLGHLTLNEVLDLHLRFKDPDAHAGLANLGYTRKGETKQGELSTEELVDNILDSVDNGDRKKLGDAILRYWEWKYDSTNEHFIDEYGRPLPHVPKYSGQIRYEKQPSDPVEDMSYEARLQKMYDRGGDPNSLKSREGNFDRRLKVEDPFDRLFKQSVEIDHWRGFSRKNRQLDRLVNDPEVDKRIRHTYGDNYKAMLTSSIEMTTGARSTPIESRNPFAKFLGGNIATGFMGGNDFPVQMTRQLTGLLNLSSEVPLHKISTGIAKGAVEAFKKDGGEFGKYLQDSRVYQDRKSHILRDVHQLQGGEKALPLSVRNGLLTVKDFGMLATAWGGRTADALGGYSAYLYAKGQGKTHEQAVTFADSAVDRTQSSMRESEKTFFERGGGFQSLMLTLQKQNVQAFHIEKNTLLRAVIQKDKASVAKAVSVVAAYHASAAIYTMISVSPTLLSKDDYAKDKAWEKVWWSAGAGTVSTAPLLISDVIYGSLASEPQHAPDTVPGRLAANTISGVRDIVAAAQLSAEKGEFLMDDFLEAAHKMKDASTILTGLPISTTERTVTRYSPLITGENK